MRIRVSVGDWIMDRVRDNVRVRVHSGSGLEVRAGG